MENKLLRVKGNKKGQVKCPFCGETHTHGVINGYRITHCRQRFKDNSYVDEEGVLYYRKDGYYIEFNK